MCDKHKKRGKATWRDVIDSLEKQQARKPKGGTKPKRILSPGASEKGLNDAIKTHQQTVTDGLDVMWVSQRDRLGISEVEQALASEVTVIPWEQGFQEDADTFREGAYAEALEGAVEDNIDLVDPKLAKVGANLNRASFTADMATFIQDRGEDFLSTMTQRQISSSKIVLRHGLENGLSSRETQRLLKQFVPLDEVQTKALLRQRLALEEAGATKRNIDRAIGKRTAKMKRERVERIVVNEFSEAYNEATLQQYNRANAQIDGEIWKQNITADDERVDECCNSIHLKVLPLDKKFEPVGCPARLRPPYHVRCRDTIVAVIQEPGQPPPEDGAE